MCPEGAICASEASMPEEAPVTTITLFRLADISKILVQTNTTSRARRNTQATALRLIMLCKCPISRS